MPVRDNTGNRRTVSSSHRGWVVAYSISRISPQRFKSGIMGVMLVFTASLTYLIPPCATCILVRGYETITIASESHCLLHVHRHAVPSGTDDLPNPTRLISEDGLLTLPAIGRHASLK